MTQFEVWDYDFQQKEAGVHPCVLISHPDAYRSRFINVLYCTSQRQSRLITEIEVLLDVEDGFNWQTFCNCSIFWSIERRDLLRRRGHVTIERRRAIQEKIRAIFLERFY